MAFLTAKKVQIWHFQMLFGIEFLGLYEVFGIMAF
jgi:hypothetical protein